MFRYFNTLFCLLLMAAALFLSDSVSAIKEKKSEIQERINTLKDEMEKTRKKLESEENKLNSQKNEKKKVLDELDHTENKIESVHRNLWKIRKEENYLKNEISKANKQHIKSVTQLRNHSELYCSRLRSVYKRQSVSVLEIMFSSGSVSSFLWGMKMLSHLAEEDLLFLDELRSRQDTIQVAMNRIKTTLDAKLILAKVKQREERDLSFIHRP